MAKAIDMRAAAAKFFQATQFAVAGASSDRSKFGHRIFAWYLEHDLPAIPVNPTIPNITCQNRTFDTVPSPLAVSSPKTTSLSVITPPPVTAKLLQEAKEAGILSVWLQPGSFTDKELEYAIENWPGAAVGGYADGTVGHEGWCVLVDGDTAIDAARQLENGKRQVWVTVIFDRRLTCAVKADIASLSDPRKQNLSLEEKPE